MPKLALMFFLVALALGVFSFSGAPGSTRRAARILFFVALGAFVGSIALALTTEDLTL